MLTSVTVEFCKFVKTIKILSENRFEVWGRWVTYDFVCLFVFLVSFCYFCFRSLFCILLILFIFSFYFHFFSLFSSFLFFNFPYRFVFHLFFFFLFISFYFLKQSQMKTIRLMADIAPERKHYTRELTCASTGTVI